ncbi:unnamed protein product, partial [Allacma fusca]
MARGWHHWWVNSAEKLLPLNIEPELVEAMCKYTPKVKCRNGVMMDIIQCGNIAVFDLKNVSLKQVTSIKCIQMILKTAREMSSSFPSISFKCLVINCPAFVGFLVKIIRPIIALTNVSLECYDDNEEIWKEVLLRHVHP